MCISLTLYCRKGSRYISNIPPRHTFYQNDLAVGNTADCDRVNCTSCVESDDVIRIHLEIAVLVLDSVDSTRINAQDFINRILKFVSFDSFERVHLYVALLPIVSTGTASTI
jgi:hypothetical protein